MNRIISIIVLSALLLTGAASRAIASDTIPAPVGYSVFEMMPLICPLMGTSNPAAMSLCNFSNINLAGAGYLFGKDEIKLVQQPEKTLFWDAGTKGYMKLGKLSFFGSFGYSNSSYHGVMYNGTLRFNSLNPYILGDTIPARQFKEQFDMQGKVSYILSDRLILGIDALYTSAVGARGQDPRHKNTLSSLKITPGILYNLGKTRLGLSGSFSTTSDEIDYQVTGNWNQDLFLLLGLGFYREESEISSYSQWYTGKGYSGAFQASRSSGNITALAEISYDHYKEETRSGSTFRLLDGITWVNKFGLTSLIRIGRDKTAQLISIKGYYTAVNSDEIQQRSNYPVNTGTYTYYIVHTDSWKENKQMLSDIAATFSYSYLTFDRDNCTDIDAGVSVNLQYFETGYYPVEINGIYDVLNIGGSLYARKQMRIRSLIVTPGIEAGYRMNLSADISFNPPPDVRCFPEIAYHNYYVLKANVLSAAASVRFELPLIQNSFVKSLFFIPKGTWASAPGTEAGDLTGYMIRATAGITF